MQEQKKFRYIYNNEEVSREDFEKLAGDSFKWFDGDSIVSVPFSSFDSFFNGDFKSRRQINDHLDSVLNIYQNKVTEDIINKPKCSPQCFCDGSCKKQQEKNTNSTRHKSQAGETHKENFLVDSTPLGITDTNRAVVIELEKDDVITNSNRGEKETIEALNNLKNVVNKSEAEIIKEVLEENKEPLFMQGFGFIPKRGKVIQYKNLEKKGVKHNKLKPRLDVVINTQFPKALQLISLATEYGNSKYKETDLDMLNFKRVAGGSQTYFDSCARHSTDRNGLDESGLPHIIHAVWSSLAGLELWAEENKINIKEFTENYMKNLQD